VYGAAATLLDNAHVRRVVQQSYAGVYVDEYQDCTADQHALIMKLAGILPCRVLGDPLQGIFDFGGQQLVRWEEDVFSAFERLPDLVTPWRWLGHNEELGQWLLGVRELLLAGAPIDLADAPVEWFERSEETEREVCMAQLRHEGQSVVGIRKWASECHALAKTLKGRFTSMEEMDCRDLLSWSDRLELSEGTTRASLALEFGRECLTTSMSTTTALIQKLQRGEVPRITARCPAPGLYEALRGISENNDLARVSGVLIEVRKQGGPLYRRELWDEMMRALRYRKEGVGESLKDAAWHCRNITRQSGRREESRSISRTLLIKGLEYDRALVLNADELGAKNLYVAITRGRRALTIVSRSRVVQPAARN
jgi:DNA helicase-2/ATP-dependent DNA helicase PcrA